MLNAIRAIAAMIPMLDTIHMQMKSGTDNVLKTVLTIVLS